MINLEEILSYCPGGALPGVLIIEYTPMSWVYSTERIMLGWNWQQQVVFEAGKTWLRLPVIPVGRLWNENSARTEQGKHFEQSVGGTTPKLRPDVTGQFDLMANDQYILRLTDRHGQPWLLGNADNPFDFDAEASLDQANAYNISFTSQTARRAAGYMPAF